MRVVYLTDETNERLREIFSDEFDNFKSDVLEFVEEGEICITIRNHKGKLVLAIIKDSTIYIEEQDSGISEILERREIDFSPTLHNKILDERVEQYFNLNTYSRPR